MSVRDPSVRLVHTVQTVLESGRVADWEALVAQVPLDRLRGAIQTARISQDLRQLAYRLLDPSDHVVSEHGPTLLPHHVAAKAVSSAAPTVCEE